MNLIDGFADAFSAGLVVDAVIALVVVEFVAIAVLWRQPPLWQRIQTALLMLLPGACLLIALRLAVTDHGWQPISAVLALAGITHAADLWNRLRK